MHCADSCGAERSSAAARAGDRKTRRKAGRFSVSADSAQIVLACSLTRIPVMRRRNGVGSRILPEPPRDVTPRYLHTPPVASLDGSVALAPEAGRMQEPPESAMQSMDLRSCGSVTVSGAA